MATNKVTYTGTIGPGNTVTSLVFNDVVDLRFNFIEQTVTISYTTAGAMKVVTLSLSNEATVTYTIATGIATVAIST